MVIIVENHGLGSITVITEHHLFDDLKSAKDY
jgi:hypothetical protein